MRIELIDRIAEMLEQVSDETEFLYRISTDEIIYRDAEFLDENTLGLKQQIYLFQRNKKNSSPYPVFIV